MDVTSGSVVSSSLVRTSTKITGGRGPHQIYRGREPLDGEPGLGEEVPEDRIDFEGPVDL